MTKHHANDHSATEGDDFSLASRNFGQKTVTQNPQPKQKANDVIECGFVYHKADLFVVMGST